MPKADKNLIAKVREFLPLDVSLHILSDTIDTENTENLLAQLSFNEKSILSRTATEKRVREFCLGRIAAKSAIEQLNLKPTEILRSEGGLPVWPAGIVGSISHCTRKAICIAAKDEHYIGIGADLLTSTRKVNPKITETLCSLDEKSNLEAGWQGELNTLNLMIFSAKESLYKLLSSIGFKKLEWHDLKLSIDSVDLIENNFTFNVVFPDNFMTKISDNRIKPITFLKVNSVIHESYIISTVTCTN